MNLQNIYSLEDLLVGFIWAVILLAIGFMVKTSRQAKDLAYKWFMPNLLFKMGMGLFFGFVFVKILGYGGDTVAYWEGAVKLNNLFWESPTAYLNELFSTPSRDTINVNFNYETGFPPGWIYNEPESFFVSKVLSIFGLVTFNSFTALTFICSYFAAIASFRLFQLVRKYHFTKEVYMAIATMFIPTVAFWCSGISKDTMTLLGLYFLLYYLFALFDRSRKFTFSNFIWVTFFIWFTYQMRPFMIVAIFIPLTFSFGFGYLNRLKSRFIVASFKFIVILASLGVITYVTINDVIPMGLGEEYIEELAISQQDFATNTTYGGPRYDLGISEFSPAVMVTSMPLAIFTGLYRPFLWEAEGSLLLMSGLENLSLILLTIGFFFKRGNIKEHLRYVTENEFLVFALIFAILFAFFIGFSVGLFNVLVRFKAPLLAFLLLVLISRKPTTT